MKILAVSAYFAFLISFNHQAEAYQSVSNVRGETIVFFDEENLAAQNTKSQNWESKTQEILFSAMSLQGIKYKYGGNTPETGFDCSGFVKYVFHEAANVNLPRTTLAISKMGYLIQKDQLQPGDLVFFNTLRTSYSHVGIYVGDQKFIHSPRSGSSVRIEKMNTQYWKKRYDGAQRLDQEVISLN